LHDGAGPPQQRLRLVDAAALEEMVAQAVERARDVRMIRTHHRLEEGQGASAEVLALGETALRAIEIGDVREEAGHLHRARRARVLFEGESAPVEPLRLG